MCHPIPDQGLSRFPGAYAHTLAFLPQAPWVDGRVRELAGMADEPAFQPIHVGFGVELQGKDTVADTEGLMGRHGCGGQQFGPFGQVENVAVPVQNGQIAIKKTQRRSLARLGQLKGAPADFLFLARIDAGVEHGGYKLRAEADAEQRLAGNEP